MSRLLTVSPELHLSIISRLSLSDKHYLRHVNRKFNNFLMFEVPLEELRAARKENTIFLIENADKEDIGFQPFIIQKTSVRREKILLDIYHPMFMEKGGSGDDDGKKDEEDDEVPNENEWEITIEIDDLYLRSPKDKWSSKPARLIKSVDYELLREKLTEASAALLRARFVCPECGDRTYPDLFASCGSMPCPVCIGSEAAYESKCLEDDEEELEALWEGIDEMLAKEKAAL
ncbi:hypothetical protein C8J57DRAFT_1247954 [Mycena rebaudengoi]|nr:hypothetical protein C8J57DRAFT_1247954 [Mycena rebaudengoi]